MKSVHTTMVLTGLAALMVFAIPTVLWSKTKNRTVQEVNFSEMNLKGTIRNPDGAYLVQKKVLNFYLCMKCKKI